MARAPKLRAVRSEFAGAQLRDKRLTRRLEKVVETVSSAPSKGFPQVMSSSGELEALYRLLSNERVGWREILAPHLKATADRCRAAGVVVVAHDTTQFTFGGKSRADSVGHLRFGNAGFLGHFALALSADEEAVPLGVLGLHPIQRDPVVKKTWSQRRQDDRKRPFQDKESHRWLTLTDEVREVLGDVATIHVMDREADDFVLLAALHSAGHRFVIRSAGDRKLLIGTETSKRLKEALREEEDVLFREVVINARAKSGGRPPRPPRGERTARLHIRARAVTFPRPNSERECGPTRFLPVNVVEVFEPTPPEGEEAVSWRLMTTEPIATAEERARIVDFYRARWRIEEFFKSLKTGCAYEKRQLESEHALLNALAILTPIAWRLLVLRHVARRKPDERATLVFTEDQLALLRILSKRVKLPKEPSMQDALLAIAGIGGHLKNNGPPGWLTLGRGYEDFSNAYVGWLAARATM